MDTSTAKSISIGDIAIKMFLIVTVPVIIGMLFRKFLSPISISFEPLAKKISAVLFDLDGVTIDTEPLYTLAEIRLFGEYGVEIPKEDLHLFRGSSEETFFNLSMERYAITEDRDTFIKKGRQYVMDEFKKNMPFVPGFKKLCNAAAIVLIPVGPAHVGLGSLRAHLKEYVHFGFYEFWGFFFWPLCPRA